MQIAVKAKSLFSSLIFTSVIEFIRLIKGTFIISSSHNFFYVSNCCAPLIGMLGIHASSLVFILRTLLALASVPYKHILLVYHLPTFCGALYYQRHPLLTYTIIGLSFVLFLMHPIGWQARLYSLYWFIPLFATSLPHKSTFFDALGSTFTTHAVGSVIWLYTHTMTANMWLSLIPVVAFERLIFAAGMTLCLLSVRLVRSTASRARHTLPISSSTIHSTSPT
jgi:hypothetical protein